MMEKGIIFNNLESMAESFWVGRPISISTVTSVGFSRVVVVVNSRYFDMSIITHHF